MKIDIKKIFEAQKNRKDFQDKAKKLAKEQAEKVANNQKCRDKDETEYLNELAYKSVTSIIQNDIGSRLVSVREQNKLTQQDIADELGDFWEIDKSTICKWENGTNGVSFVYLLWLSQQFDVDLHWLLTGQRRSPKETIAAEIREKLEEVCKISQKL